MKCHISKTCWRLKTIQLTTDASGLKLDINAFDKESPKAPTPAAKEACFSLSPFLETPFGKVYGFLPVLRYIARNGSGPTVYGLTETEKAHIDSWISMIYEKFEEPLAKISCKTLTFDETIKKQFFALLDQLEAHLTSSTFIDTRLGLADYYLYVPFVEFFKMGLVKASDLFSARPALKRWVLTVGNQKNVKKIVGDVNFEKDVSSKPAAAEGDEDEAPKKKKNPLEDLPPTTMNLDAWKRQYSNTKDLHGVAMPWFWENLDTTGWSVWHMKYNKLEDECKVNYASSNLLRGFLQRIDPEFRKYSFGVTHVLGETGDFNIEGMWMVRGQELPFEFTDHVSYEYHTFTKLDTKDATAKKQIAEYWCNEETIGAVKIEDSKVWK